MQKAQTPIQAGIRASISDHEWKQLKKDAIDRDLELRDYIALLLREGRKALRDASK